MRGERFFAARQLRTVSKTWLKTTGFALTVAEPAVTCCRNNGLPEKAIPLPGMSGLWVRAVRVGLNQCNAALPHLNRKIVQMNAKHHVATRGKMRGVPCGGKMATSDSD